ncbi:membrane protein [Frigoribacterium faeni]|uniref:Membrane protein n=2 Tax=Frigoribacterium faeni TaxID=145483 RepID=A0ABQ0UTG5_9MICO|nr:membrane protein [Microbacterium flavescens]GEK84704.1 membrane protein [Frigoribacterium faeni]
MDGMSPRISRPAVTSRDAARAVTTARVLAVALGGSGVLHLVRPAVYDSIVPRALPGSARFYTIASGVAEVGIAAALASRPTRRVGGLLAAALFVAVFPANVSMATRSLRSSRAFTARRLVTVLRLPLQWPLVTAALRVARAS